MKLIDRRKFGRRALLGGAAAFGALAPFVPTFNATGQSDSFPRRLVLFFTPNGLQQEYWGADGEGTEFTLRSILQPLAGLERDLVVLEGIDLASWSHQNPQPPNDHPPVLGHVLTAHDTIDPVDGSASANSSTWFAGHRSIDQFIAAEVGKQTLRESLVLGVQSGGALARLSYRGAKDPVPPYGPDEAFDAIFEGVGLSEEAFEARLAGRQSVIDAVAADLDALRSKVAAEDKFKIDQHLDRLRAYEQRLVDAPKHCTAPDPTAHDAEQHAFVREGRRQIDHLVMALACDITRVVNLQWSVASTGSKYPWIEHDGGYLDGPDDGHHALAHATPHDEPVRLKLAAIGRWYASQYRYLLDQLASIPEGDGTLLDHTTVLWYSEHAANHGGHDRSNLPLLLAGSCGGSIETGRVLRFDHAAHNDLFVALCHAMGMTDVATFGNPAVCTGPLPGLLAT